VTQPWWRDAVCYQLYIRSFADSDGDGKGDLDGITAHLDHLVDLGVDALWLNPFYPSPQHDHGYDVSNFRDVEPAYGTLATFDHLLAEAHARGLKLLGDIVPNHTSSDHPWFQAALAAAPGSPERDRYLFRPGKGPDGSEPPNNWLSAFGGPAWTRVPDGEWYLHMFDTSQPDLNWRNPEIPADFEKTLRFWLDRGVDGFRVDVAHALFKKEGLPDVPDPESCLDGTALDTPMWEQPEGHAVFRRWHQILAEYDGARMAVGEAWCPPPERTALYVRPGELQQTFNFHWLLADWSAASFHEAIDTTRTSLARVGARATWVLSNHDVVRHPTRYGGGVTGRSRGRAATLAMLALPGSSYLYQGEELGLEQVDVPPAARQDPEFLHGRGPGRDGCRVPIPWSGDAPPYGFGSGAGQPWLPQPDDWSGVTVAAERADPDSTLAFYRHAIRVRATLLVEGWDDDIEWLDLGADVLAFRRGPITVAVNCGAVAVELPDGDILAATEELDGKLPADAGVWLR
jgi:alpha-glucosidase